MCAICGARCSVCSYRENKTCKGCAQSEGCPFGTPCFIYRYIKTCGNDAFSALKKQLISEINELNIPGMRPIDDLYPIVGSYVNLGYPTPGGDIVHLLDDQTIYLCNQVPADIGGETRCFGIAVGMDFLLVSNYGDNASDPEIVIYKER